MTTKLLRATDRMTATSNPERTEDTHVRQFERLLTPRSLKGSLPITEMASAVVSAGRNRIIDIMNRKDTRLLAIVGPCSIHDPKAALEYANRLKDLREEVSDRIELVMRVYFEKPRTTVGWKGLINDPHLDNSDDIDAGLKTARKLLLDIAGMGIPAATEFLDPYTPQYIADLVSWAAIGARTTESQTHREMASGLSMPVGLKNGTDGSLSTPIDALITMRTPHSFIGIDEDGIASIVRTTGNPYGHIVLRGGKSNTNYDPQSINMAETELAAKKLPQILMVDCSHANSEKKHNRQEAVWQSVIEDKMPSVIGLMVESNLREGNQQFPKGAGEKASLQYGVSITDPCVGWDTTVRMVKWAYDALGERP